MKPHILRHLLSPAVGITLSLLFAACPSLAQNAQVSDTTLPKNFVSIRPLSWVTGPQIGYDYVLNPKMTIGGELNVPLWFLLPPMVALSPVYKYYTREVGKGWYFKGRLIGGWMLEPDRENLYQSWFAGLGGGAGYMTPIGKSNKWHFFIELGVNLVFQGDNPNYDNSTPTLPLYAFFAPYSILEPTMGISYRF